MGGRILSCILNSSFFLSAYCFCIFLSLRPKIPSPPFILSPERPDLRRQQRERESPAPRLVRNRRELFSLLPRLRHALRQDGPTRRHTRRSHAPLRHLVSVQRRRVGEGRLGGGKSIGSPLRRLASVPIRRGRLGLSELSRGKVHIVFMIYNSLNYSFIHSFIHIDYSLVH